MSVNMTNLAFQEEENSFTYRDYKGWELARGERYELLEGEPLAMAAPNDRHQAILLALAAQLYNFLQGKPCKVRPAPYDVRLFYEEDESDDTVVQPDLSVICDEKKRGSEGCRGAPDLVVEILSPSNTAIVMYRKMALYRDAGVREYWVVDPEDRQITVHVLENGEYRVHSFRGGPDCSAVLPGLEINLEQVFAE